MKVVFATAPILVLVASLAPMKAFAECDALIGNVVSKYLRPVIENIDCAVAKEGGLDKREHELKRVCYQSSGPTSHIIIAVHLECHSSSESVVSKLVGYNNAPSVSENVAVEADVTGANCHLNYLNVKPSGELGKVLVALFDVNGKARMALEQSLAEACKK